ncbi:hypothetical protein [Phenylobacterium sp.]|jgi:hypothetical protein|uniref:DUF6841 family protein n=1 Tax=Phenylobacterium sp. TaxID=1871053 RepID=UPI002F4180DE
MTQNTEAEVAQLFADYRKTFNEDDIEGCLRYFAIPCTLTSFGRVLYLDTPEKFVSHWSATHAKMRSSYITNGRISKLKVYPLDDDTAAAAVVFDRVNDKGEILTQQAGAYHLFKWPEGWKVVSFIMHRAEAWMGDINRA